MQKFKLTIKDLKSQLEKYNENANVIVIFKNKNNQLVFTDTIEIYNRTQMLDDKLTKDEDLVFIDICN